MCETIENVRQDKRRSCDLPCGATVSLNDLNYKFADIPRGRRGEISRRVLAALPNGERFRFNNWVETTTKMRPVNPGHVELMMFLSIGHHASTTNAAIEDVVAKIVTQKSAVGVLLRAA